MSSLNINYSYDISKTRSLVAVGSIASASTLLWQDINKLDNTKKYRKYFGKKIQNLSYQYKAPSWASDYRCKVAKNLKVYGPFLRKTPFKTVKTLTFYNKRGSNSLFDIRQNKKESRFLRRISGYKALTKLELHAGNNLFSLSKLPALSHLQEVFFVLSHEQQLISNGKALLNLRSLRKCTLWLDFASNFSQEMIVFFTKLLSMKTLRYVNLDLSKISFKSTPELADKLLADLQQAQALAFHVLMRPPRNLGLERVRAALEYMDLVTFASKIWMFSELEFGVNNSNSIEELEKPLHQARKRLDFIISTDSVFFSGSQSKPNTQSESIFKSLDLFSSITGIGKFNSLDRLTAKNLRSFTLSFKQIDNTLYELTVQRLIKVLKNSPYLKELNLKDARFDRFGLSREPDDLFEEIFSSKTLTNVSFEYFRIAESYLRLLEKPIRASNLNKLNLYIRVLTREEKGFNLNFSFNSLVQLTELRIVLPNLSKDSHVKFINNLSNLSSLKCLEIYEGIQLFEDPNFRKKLFKSFESLLQLKTVKLFQVDTSLKKGTHADKIKTKIIADESESGIKALFAHNLSLEQFSAIHVGLYEIQYKR